MPTSPNRPGAVSSKPTMTAVFSPEEKKRHKDQDGAVLSPSLTLSLTAIIQPCGCDVLGERGAPVNELAHAGALGCRSVFPGQPACAVSLIPGLSTHHSTLRSEPAGAFPLLHEVPGARRPRVRDLVSDHLGGHCSGASLQSADSDSRPGGRTGGPWSCRLASTALAKRSRTAT